MKLSDLPNWLVESDIDLRKLKQKSESKPIEAIEANMEVVEAIKLVKKNKKEKKIIKKVSSEEDSSEASEEEYVKPKKTKKMKKKKKKKVVASESSSSEESNSSEESDYESRIQQTKNLKKYFKQK